jgi:anti-sigma B factor antagonist
MADLAVHPQSETGAGYDLVEVRGELDLKSHDELRGLTGSTELEADLLVLDLTELAFLDSAGIGAIALAHRQVGERDAELVVVASSPQLVRVLEISGMHQAVRICATRDEVTT